MVANRNITVQLYSPHTGQKPIHRSKARFRVVTCGRRFGKTFLACNEMVKFSCEHANTLSAWVSPSYRQSKIAYRLIKQALGAILSHSSDSELTLELPNHARLIFCSSDNYNALRGIGVHFLIIDECADVNEKAWTEVLRPTLSDTKGKALFTGTPKGRNFFYTLYQRGLDPMYPEWESFTAPSSANPYIPREEIEAAKKDTPEMIFQQEYEAIFLESGAGVFTGIDGCIHGGMLDPDPNTDYVIGWDIAKYRDYSVITIINCQTMHVDYWQRTNHVDYTMQVEDVCILAQRYNYAYILQDSTGVGDPVLEQVKRRGFRADGYLFTNASKKILIEGLIVGIQNKYVSFPHIPVLIAELQQMEYTFTQSRLISYAAPDGAHDDTVMSLALAYHAASRPHVPLAGGDDFPENAQVLSTDNIPLTVNWRDAASGEPVVVPSASNKPVDPFQWADDHYGGDW